MIKFYYIEALCIFILVELISQICYILGLPGPEYETVTQVSRQGEAKPMESNLQGTCLDKQLFQV
jgi:hypothetical protein